MDLLTLALVIVSLILAIHYGLQAIKSSTLMNVLLALFYALLAIYIYL